MLSKIYAINITYVNVPLNKNRSTLSEKDNECAQK